MRQVPILLYHWFDSPEAPRGTRSPQLCITPQLFREQLRFLERRGFRTVRLGDALAGRGLPPKPLVISFDDGTLDFWRHARPALDDCGFKATLFVVTDFVGGASSWDASLGEPARPLMSWEQIVALHREGHEIGSHTHQHRVLTELDDTSARGQLEESRRVLAERLGAPPELVAYPRGFYDERHKRLARDAGYSGACAVILNFGDLRRADRFELKRMPIKGTESMRRFRLRLALARRIRLVEARS